MKALENLKTRTALLFALVPLSAMVLIAALYASLEMKRIDANYHGLIDRDVRALENITNARAQTRQFELLLYRNIAETDIVRIRLVEADIDKAADDFGGYIEAAAGEKPDRTSEIRTAATQFYGAVNDARAVRAATLGQQSAKALRAMRGVESELNEARRALAEEAIALDHAIDERTLQLSANTRNTIVVTWVVILAGLLASVAVAVTIVQKQVVAVLLTLRSSIQDVAEGRLNKPIPFGERANEIGEISRALATLQEVAREQELQTWIKSQIAALAEQLTACTTYGQFGRRLLSGLSMSLGLIDGAVYRADASRGLLVRIGKAVEGGESGVLRFGEGTAGQVAADRCRVSLPVAGSEPPHFLHVMPLANPDMVLAVLELVTPGPLDARAEALLTPLLRMAANNLEILAGNIETNELLEQTKRQSEAVAAAEERSRLILGSVSDGIAGLDANGHITFVNAGGSTLLGLRARGDGRNAPAHAGALRLPRRVAVSGRTVPDAEHRAGRGAAARRSGRSVLARRRHEFSGRVLDACGPQRRQRGRHRRRLSRHHGAQTRRGGAPRERVVQQAALRRHARADRDRRCADGAVHRLQPRGSKSVRL